MDLVIVIVVGLFVLLLIGDDHPYVVNVIVCKYSLH